MKRLRLPEGKEWSETRSAVDGRARTTIRAAQGVTVVLTVAVGDARLARSVAIQWHRAREGLQKTGTTPADGPEGETTITYSFAADRPGTFIYHARYRRDRAAGLVKVRRREAGPSAGGRARTHEGHDVVNVPRRDHDGSSAAAGGSARTAVPRRYADGRARGSRGRASVEAQLMADCPVIHYDAREYGGGPPVQRLLRWSGAALAAAAVWVSGLCGPRDPD